MRSASALAAFLELSPDAVVLVDHDGRVVDANAQVETLFGWTVEDLRGRHVEVLVPEGRRPVHDMQRAGYQAAPSVRTMAAGRDLCARHRDGHGVPVDISLTPIETADGPVVAAVARDVRQRRESEVRLAQWSDLFDRAAFAMLVGRKDAPIIDRANPAAEALCGYEPGELDGQPLATLFPPGHEQELADHVRTVNEQGREQFESVMVRKDGTALPVRVDVTAIHDDAGEVAFRVAYVEDLTERRHAEQQARDWRDRLSSSVEAMPDAVLFVIPVLDPDGHVVGARIAYANRAAEAVLDDAGRRGEDGRGPSRLPTWLTTDLLAELRTRTARDAAVERDVQVQDDEGRDAAYQLRAARTGEGELVLVLRDVTEQRGAQRQLQAVNDRLRDVNRELEAATRHQELFVSTASHELRTPMATIQGFAETLSSRWHDLEDAERRQLFEAIQRGVARQTALLSDLLDVARIRAGRLVLDLRPVELDRIVADSVEAADVTGLRVDVGDVRVRADEVRLVQVLVNLLTNAAKYGAPPVDVVATPCGDDVEVTVRDHGPGVPGAFRDQLFDMFAQASRGDSRTATGTGLGLFIVRQLTEAQGGQVAFRPADPGACFVVRLPRG